MKNLLKCNKSPFITLTITLVATLWLISLCDIVCNLNLDLTLSQIALGITSKFVMAFEAVLLLALVFYPLILLFERFQKPLFAMSTKIAFTIVVMLQFATGKYDFSLLPSLNNNLFGFSTGDMVFNVQPSSSAMLLHLTLFIFFPFFYLVVEKHISKLITPKRATVQQRTVKVLEDKKSLNTRANLINQF